MSVSSQLEESRRLSLGVAVGTVQFLMELILAAGFELLQQERTVGCGILVYKEP